MRTAPTRTDSTRMDNIGTAPSTSTKVTYSQAFASALTTEGVHSLGMVREPQLFLQPTITWQRSSNVFNLIGEKLQAFPLAPQCGLPVKKAFKSSGNGNMMADCCLSQTQNLFKVCLR